MSSMMSSVCSKFKKIKDKGKKESKKVKFKKRDSKNLEKGAITVIIEQNQNKKPKQRRGRLRFKGRKYKKTDGFYFSYNDGSESSLQETNGFMKSSAAELALSLEKIKLDLQKKNVKFKLQDVGQAKYDRKGQEIYSTRSSTVVQAEFKEEGGVNKKFAEETDANDHWSEERKSKNEERIYTHEELENSPAKEWSFDVSETQSLEAESHGDMIEENKNTDVEGSFERPKKNITPRLDENFSFSREEDSLFLSSKESECILKEQEVVVREEEREDAAKSTESFTGTEDITGEKEETGIDTLNDEDVEEPLRSANKERYNLQRNCSPCRKTQSDLPLNQKLKSVEDPARQPGEQPMDRQKELQEDDAVNGEKLVEQEVGDKTESVITITEKDTFEKTGQAAMLESLHNFKVALEDFKVNQWRRKTFSDKFEKPTSWQADVDEPCKGGKVPMQDDSRGKQVQKKAPEGHEERAAHLSKMQDHNHNDDSSIGGQSVLQATGENEVPSLDKSKREDSNLEESVQEQEELQEDYAVNDGSSLEEQVVSEKAESSETITEEDASVRVNNREITNFDELGTSTCKNKDMEEPIISKYKEGEIVKQGDSQEEKVQERAPVSHEEKVVQPNKMLYHGRHDRNDDPKNKEQTVLKETGESERSKPEASITEEPLKYSPDSKAGLLEYPERHQGTAQENDQGRQDKEETPLGAKEKEERKGDGSERKEHFTCRNDFQESSLEQPEKEQVRDRKKLREGNTVNGEIVLEQAVSETTESLETIMEKDTSVSLNNQGETISDNDDDSKEEVREKAIVGQEEKVVEEIQDKDRQDQCDVLTKKDLSPLLDTDENKEHKLKASKIEAPLKSSPDQEETLLACTERPQEDVAKEDHYQVKSEKEKGPLSHEQKNGHLDEMQDLLDETEQNKGPKPEVSMIEEPLKYSPDHEESSLEYSEGQQEEVAAEGDSQEKQIKEKGPLSHEQTNGHLDEMQDRDRHDQKVVPTNKEPLLLQETGQNEQPKREVSKIEEPLKSSPDHEEYTEGQQEEVATEGDSQEKQVEEKGPLSHEEKNGNLDEMQYRDRHDQPVHPTIKESSVFEENGENKERKPEVSEIEETLKSSPNYDENSFEHTERQEGVVASQDDSRGKREQEKAPMSFEVKCINQEKIQDYDRHDQHDDRRNKNSELQKTGETKELKREGSDLDDPVISNCDNEEMSLEHTERQQVQEKKELLQNEAVEVESLVEQPVSDQTESIQTIIEDDAVVTVNNQEITNSNELRISNGKQTDKREPPVLPKNKKDVVATQDDSQQVQGEAPVSHEEEVLHLRTIQDYDGHAMHGDPSNNAQSKSVLPETGESKQTTLEQYKIEERLKINPDYKESSLEYLERQEEAATQNDFEEKKVEEKVPLTYEERSLHPGEMQDHDRHIKPDNSKNKDQSVLQETSENEKPKLHASKIAEPLKSFSNNEDRTLECLERQQKEVATQDDSPVKQVQEKALVGHKEQVMHPDKMQDLDRQFQQNDFTSKNQSVLQGKEERKREGLERKEPLESSCNFEERLLENLEREQVKNEKKMQEDNAVNGGSVVEQADSDKTESLETINEEDAFVSLNNLVNASSDDDDFQEQQEREISLVGHEEKVLEELLDKDLIQQHQYGDLTDKDLIVQPETSENQEPKLKATKIEEFDSQDKQVKEKGPSMHEQKIVHLDEVQDLDQHDQQDDPTQKEPPVLQEIGENEEARLEDSELEELKIKETLRSSCDYEEKSLENPDSNQVQQQKELQKDDIVGENVVEQEVIDKTESIETMIKDICFSASSRVTADSDEFDKTSSKQTNTTDPILSKCKENEVPLQGDCQDRPVQKEAPVRHEANVEVHDGFYLQDDPADNNQPVVQMTNNNTKLKLKEPIKPSFDNEEWPEQREAPLVKKRIILKLEALLKERDVLFRFVSQVRN
ncbi:unnamed protein product [Porites evermanni]|uniref:Uncharacterized protein n=1 Tax=Porites evermanni TaxID=104178 RepID=A0ABN8SVQ5_9CNID|nr:unnamed protein product [Porites evermanni]